MFHLFLEIKHVVSVRNFTVYACSIIAVNTLGFLVVMACYVDMFCRVRGSNAAGESDLKIARRMGVLIFSNFVCWGPVIVVSALSAGKVY